MEVFIKHKRSEESIWGSRCMNKFEYKLTFKSDSENIIEILDNISETIRMELLDKIINPMPLITMLEED